MDINLPTMINSLKQMKKEMSQLHIKDIIIPEKIKTKIFQMTDKTPTTDKTQDITKDKTQDIMKDKTPDITKDKTQDIMKDKTPDITKDKPLNITTKDKKIKSIKTQKLDKDKPKKLQQTQDIITKEKPIKSTTIKEKPIKSIIMGDRNNSLKTFILEPYKQNKISCLRCIRYAEYLNKDSGEALCWNCTVQSK
jgi:hypothetical protein